MNKLLLLISIILLGTFLSLGQSNASWKEVKQEASLLFEVKSSNCIIRGREQVLILVRLTNTSNEKRTFTWKVNKWREGTCVNCNNNSSEQFVTVTLNPGESIEGTCDSKLNKATYIFDHYVKWVEGMTKHNLSNYEFVQISSLITL